MEYRGNIKNGKRNGYGELYKNNKLLWSGMWIDNAKIDDIKLPDEVPIREDELNLDSCQILTFEFNIVVPNRKHISNDFDLSFSVPSIHFYPLDKIIDKVVKLTNYSDSKDISVNVSNTECDISRDSIYKLLEIDNIIQYITKLDYECSNCNRFNRGWQCCGQFAPFLYMYHKLLYENEYETHYKDRFGQNTLNKPSQIYNIANVFYKMFTGYANNIPNYKQLINNIHNLYNTFVPNHLNNLKFWNIKYHSEYAFCGTRPMGCSSNRTITLDNHNSYLLLLTKMNGVGHYCFVYRHNDDVILCDSWSHASYSRRPVLRIMKNDIFVECVTKINDLYVYLNNPREYDDDDEMLHDLLLYNFILDSLFLVPYNLIDIKKGKLNFREKKDNLFYVSFIDPHQVHTAFDILEQKSDEPFGMVLSFGGGKKSNKSSKKNKVFRAVEPSVFYKKRKNKKTLKRR